MALDTGQTRRRTLQLAALALAAGGTGIAAAQDGGDDEDDSEDDAGDEAEQTVILGARSSYWYGLEPPEIEGEENPTLDLGSDGEVEIVWINLDGALHNLALEDADGERLEVSEETETPGEAVSMTVDADDSAAEYYCEHHPDSMRGDVGERNDEADESDDDGGSDDGHDRDRDHEHEHDGNRSDDDC